MKCKCGETIPELRLEIFPDTKCCAKCSTVPMNRAFMVYSHKTAGEVVTVDASNPENIRLAERAYRRAR